MRIALAINNQPKTLDVQPNDTLIDLLREHGCWSVRRGCETGDCGNCTVIVDGHAVYSCLMLAAQADGKTIETFENISVAREYAYLKEVFMHYGDLECGYCLAGFMMSVKALLDNVSDPSEEEIVDSLTGNICRCAKRALPISDIMEAIQKRRGKF